jgi:hypothetical protein
MCSHEDLEIVMSQSRAHIFAPVSINDIQILRECALFCRLGSKVCIKSGYMKEALLCAECAEVCDLAIKFKSCHSVFLAEVYKLCTLICQKCEMACSKLKLKECQKCAEVCKKCLQFIALQKNKNNS